MKHYIVLYREIEMKPLDEPLAFSCQAEDTEHAEEQCVNAYPDCDVVWVYEGDDAIAALQDYWWND